MANMPALCGMKAKSAPIAMSTSPPICALPLNLAKNSVKIAAPCLTEIMSIEYNLFGNKLFTPKLFTAIYIHFYPKGSLI